jgi:hypothetical protein
VAGPIAPRSTVKKSALMTPAERQQDRIMKARLQQSEKREKLFMARRNLGVHFWHVEPSMGHPC